MTKEKSLLDLASYIRQEKIEHINNQIENFKSSKDISKFQKELFYLTLDNIDNIKESSEHSEKLKYILTEIKQLKNLAEDDLIEISYFQKNLFYKLIIEYTQSSDITFMLLNYFDTYYTKLNELISKESIKEITRKKSEERFRSLISSMFKILWIAEPNGYIVEDSEGWRNFTGQSYDEMKDLGWLDKIHPEDREKVKNEWLNCVKTLKIKEIEFRLKRSEGGYAYVVSKSVPVFSENNQVIEWIGTITDITERKYSELKLIEESKINETLYRVGILLSAELDVEKLIINITEECKNLISAEFAVFLYNISDEKGKYELYTASGISIEKYKEFELPSDTKILEYTFENHDIQRVFDITTNQNYGSFGNYIPQNIIRSYMAVPVISISGDIIAGLFFGHSIAGFFTERDEKVVSGIVSQAAVAIDNASLYQKTSELVSQFSILTDTVPEIIWTANPDGYKDYFNNNWYKYTGLDYDNSKGWKWKDIIHPDDVKKTIDKWNNSIITGENYEAIYRKKDKDGTFNWFLGRALPLRDDEGKIVKWFGTSTNIDAQKKAEEELERSNHELQQFAFISSHDLQEPLRVVTSYIQLLSKKYKHKIDKEADEFIGYAVDGVTRMQSLIDDLQSYSNVIQKDIKLSQVNINDILERAIERIKPEIEESNALITHENLPVITADESQLVILFENLLSNSIKYCIKQPEIHIGAELKYGEWLFHFKDNGIGIEREYYDKIFLIFQRLHNRTKYQGTGMGLAICKKIVERHKGNIWVKSDPGEGSIFYFTIPSINPQI